MTVSRELRDEVRERAGYACEFCSVRELDTAGEMTVDHFRPRKHEGNDSPENLLYVCFRCNLYKADYWPDSPDAPQLWNPRQEPQSTHLVVLDDGMLHPITPVGQFTIQRIRLYRQPLVDYRLRQFSRRQEQRLLERYREIIHLQRQLQEQQASLLREQHDLLDQQRQLLLLLLGKHES